MIIIIHPEINRATCTPSNATDIWSNNQNPKHHFIKYINYACVLVFYVGVNARRFFPAR